MRSAAAQLAPGQVSDPVVLDSGFAVLRREPGDDGRASIEAPSFEESRGLLARDARLRQERLLMERLARSLAEEASVRTLEPGLTWGPR